MQIFSHADCGIIAVAQVIAGAWHWTVNMSAKHPLLDQVFEFTLADGETLTTVEHMQANGWVHWTEYR